MRKEVKEEGKSVVKERDMIMQYHQAGDCRQRMKSQFTPRQKNEMPELMSIPIRTKNFLFA